MESHSSHWSSGFQEDNGRQHNSMDDGDEYSVSGSKTTSQRKKIKRLQKYREQWEKGSTWVKKVRSDYYKAHCTVCRRTFSIAHSGLTDVKQRASSDGHKRNIRGCFGIQRR